MAAQAPPNSIDLPVDMKLQILDYISLKSDLKALCLCTKAWRDVATPHLYADITLYLYDRKYVHAFMRSVGAGAFLHFQWTRVLTILNQSLAPESILVLEPSPEDGPFRLLGDEPTPMHSAEEAETSANLILEMIPKSILHTFRCQSSRGISESCLNILLRRQQSLQHLYGTIPARCIDYKCFHSGIVGQIWKCQLQTLDLRFAQFDDKECHALHTILKWNPNLKTLGIGGKSASRLNELWQTVVHGTHYPNYKLKLQTLRLYELDLDSMYPLLMQILDFSTLGSLDLWKCQFSNEFLAAYAAAFQGKSTKLAHLAVVDSFGTTSDPSSLAESLVHIYQASKKLRSLHLSSLDLEPKNDFLSRISGPKSTIRSLSLHSTDLDFVVYLLLLDEIYELCEELPNLQQLAFTIGAWPCYDEIPPFFTPDLKDLRILHLVQSKFSPVNLMGVRSAAAIAFDVQTLATRIFRSLEETGRCIKLRVIIIGSHNDTLPQGRPPLGPGQQHELLKQHIFYKGQQTIPGRASVVAVPITRLQLRTLEPDLDILDASMVEY